MWKVIINHINGNLKDVPFTRRQVRTKIDTLKKRYKIYKEKKLQFGIGRSEAISHIMMWLIDHELFSKN